MTLSKILREKLLIQNSHSNGHLTSFDVAGFNEGNMTPLSPSLGLNLNSGVCASSKRSTCTYMYHGLLLMNFIFKLFHFGDIFVMIFKHFLKQFALMVF